MAAAPRRWIISPKTDVLVVVLPMLAALLSLFVIRGLEIQEPLWAYLLFFVSFDVAHVWSTLYLSYLDKEAFGRHRSFLLAIVPACFLGVFALHYVSPTAFWTILAYFAIYHFAKQQYGFIAIYKALHKERAALDYRLDKLTLWVGALGPVLLWHSAPRGQFDWFGSGEEFLFTLPTSWHPWVQAAMVLVAGAWVGRQVQRWARGAGVNRGKVLWMVASWVSWYVGVRVADHLFVSAAFLNLFHGVPYLMLVWRRCNVRWGQGQAPGPGQRLVAWISQRRRLLIFYGLLLALAVVEEALWDGVVWKKYLPEATGWSGPELSAWALAAWVSLLSLPQVVHYFLDGVLWKMNAKNPDLKAMFSPQAR
jgi:hypothetical protein